MLMRILLFRHCEKDQARSDGGLSARGLRQAEKLSADVASSYKPQPQKIIASPRLRAQQSFSPLALVMNQELITWTEMDERLASEDYDLFKKRIQKALKNLEQLSGCVYVCSHLDWIEEALLMINSDTDLNQAQFQMWSPGTYIDFEVHDGLWMLKHFGGLEP